MPTPARSAAAPKPARLFIKWPSEMLTLWTSSPPTPINMQNTRPANRRTNPRRISLLLRSSCRMSSPVASGTLRAEPANSAWLDIACDTRARLIPQLRQNFWSTDVWVAQFGQYIWVPIARFTLFHSRTRGPRIRGSNINDLLGFYQRRRSFTPRSSTNYEGRPAEFHLINHNGHD